MDMNSWGRTVQKSNQKNQFYLRNRYFCKILQNCQIWNIYWFSMRKEILSSINYFLEWTHSVGLVSVQKFRTRRLFTYFFARRMLPSERVTALPIASLFATDYICHLAQKNIETGNLENEVVLTPLKIACFQQNFNKIDLFWKIL